MSKLIHGGLIITFLFFAMLLSCNDNGFRGVVFEKTSLSSSGSKIPGVTISFIKEHSGTIATTTSDVNGNYSIALTPGRYWVRAIHSAYEDYSSNPGFFVVNGSGFQTGNIFLRPASVTTVLLTRHADRANNTDTTSLSDSGFARARHLVKVLWRAGVTKMYSSSAKRTIQTLQPLADSLKLVSEVSPAPQQLAANILAHNRGDVVFVVGHSNTVPEIISALGGGSAVDIGNEFDNLFVVSIFANQATQLLNLQYGTSTTPDIIRGTLPEKKLLLVTGPLTAGGTYGHSLLHAVRTSAIRKIYATSVNNLVRPLSDTLHLPITLYNSSDVASLMTTLSTDTNKVSLIHVSKEVCSTIVTTFNAYPHPIIYSNDETSIVTITKSNTGVAKVVHICY